MADFPHLRLVAGDTPAEPAGVPPLAASPGGPHDGGMELVDRVERLEVHMAEVRSVLTRLEPTIARIDASLTATIPHLATKADLADKPGKGYMWAILGVLTGVIFAAVALGASIVK